jgi:hypothetical protein
MNGLITGLDDKPAMSWIYTNNPFIFSMRFYTLSHAKNKADLKEGSYFSPGLNVMYGDAKEI